jgi:HEPN domain-containing protein
LDGVHACSTRSETVSELSKLERASRYLERAKRSFRDRRPYEASVFYKKAQRLLLSLLRRKGIRRGIKMSDLLEGETQGIRDEYITQLIEKAWRSMGT